jgi:hypothetical protein
MGYGVLASWNGDGIGGKVTFTEQPPWRPAAAWTSGGGSCVAARGRAPLLRRRTNPPSDRRTSGGRFGARAAGRRGADRWSFACAYGGSEFKAFPVSKASGGA